MLLAQAEVETSGVESGAFVRMIGRKHQMLLAQAEVETSGVESAAFVRMIGRYKHPRSNTQGDKKKIVF